MASKSKERKFRRLNPREGYQPAENFTIHREFETDARYLDLAGKLTEAEIEFCKMYVMNGRKGPAAVQTVVPQYSIVTAKQTATELLTNPDVVNMVRYFDNAAVVSNRPPTMDEIIARLTEDWRVTTDPKLRLSLTEKIVTYLKLDQTKVSDPEQQAKLDNQQFLSRFLEEDEKPKRKRRTLAEQVDDVVDDAGVAQQVEQRPCNPQVVGSIPPASSTPSAFAEED